MPGCCWSWMWINLKVSTITMDIPLGIWFYTPLDKTLQGHFRKVRCAEGLEEMNL